MFSLSINDSNAGAEASWVSLLAQPGWEEQPIPQCAVQPCRRASTGWRDGHLPHSPQWLLQQHGQWPELSSVLLPLGQSWWGCLRWTRAGPLTLHWAKQLKGVCKEGRPHSPTSVSETEKPQFMLIFYTLNATNRLQQHRQPTRIKKFGPWGFFPPKNNDYVVIKRINSSN